MTGDINFLNVTGPSSLLGHVSSALHDANAVFSSLECILDNPKQIHSIYHEGFFADPLVGIQVLHHGNISCVDFSNGPQAILGSIGTPDAYSIPHCGASATITDARKPAITTGKDGKKYGFLQRTSIYLPTNHATDDTAPGVAALPRDTEYEAPMYRYYAAILPMNRPGSPQTVLT
jgi:Bacterial capsule synthesis protein PGA_cap